MNTQHTLLSFAMTMALGLSSTAGAKVAPMSAPMVSGNTNTSLAQHAQETATVTKIDFKRNIDGGGQLVVEFDRPLAMADVRKEGNDVLIHMGNAQVASHLQGDRFVGDYKTPVQNITVGNKGTNNEGVSQAFVRLKMDQATQSPSVFQAGPRYIVDIAPHKNETSLGSEHAKPVVALNAPNEESLAHTRASHPQTSDSKAPLVATGQPVVAQTSASSSTTSPVATPLSNQDLAGYTSATTKPAPIVSTLVAQNRIKAAPQVTYAGKPVTFNFQDVPVRTVLQLIAEEANLNIVAADSVDGTVTLKLDAVPWDQALDTVLRAKSLDKRRQGSVIWVAPQKEIASYEQAKEDARIALDNRADLNTEYLQINYHNAGAIYKALTEAKGVGGGGAAGGETGSSETGFLSPRGRLVVDERTNTLMISDIPRKIAQLKELIAVIDRPVDQVLIEARVVIATETYARELGARFGISGMGNDGRNILGSTIEQNVLNGNDYQPGFQGMPFRSINSNNGVVGALGSAALSFLRSNFALDVELSAMQREGRGEVVSNPRIVTTNQRQAVISQGKEVGYVTISSSEGSIPTPNVQFKDVLLEMKVTPTITHDGRVFLDMNVKKDEVEGYLDTSIGQVPQISKRAINTAVLVEDGQTVVVGGVYEFVDSKSINKVPFLADVPFLGNLFKKRGKQSEKAELLIFMTPRVLRVSQPAQVIRTLAPREGEK